MKKSFALALLLLGSTGLFASLKQVRIGEVFFVDKSKLEIIISGKSLENIPDGQILQIQDDSGTVMASVKSVKNNAATLKTSFVSGQFGLIKGKNGSLYLNGRDGAKGLQRFLPIPPVTER